MTSISFPYRPRVDDPQSALTVQHNVDFLAKVVEDLINNTDCGTNLVPVGATSVAVAFNQAIANPKVTAQPTSNPGGLQYWISGKTPTGFVFNLSAAAPAGGIPFDWSVRGG